MIFADPYWLLLFLLLPLLMWRYRRGLKQRHVTLSVSRQSAMKGMKTWVIYARNWIHYLRWIVMAILIVAMARPQLLWQESKTEAESIDIMLALDISPSMLSRDVEPDRLSAAKKMANDFIAGRPNDRMGLAVFAGGAFTQCPLTTDRRILQAFIKNLQVGRLKDGTSLGLGLAVAINRLKDSQSAGKAIILMTDGENNSGAIEPLEAAEMARALGVHVYVIGLGADGIVSSPAQQNFDGSFTFVPRTMQLDTLLLSEIAQRAKGKFYRAQTAAQLSAIYAEIDRLEKTKISTVDLRRTTDLFFWLLNAAICLMVLELLLRWGPLRVITI